MLFSDPASMSVQRRTGLTQRQMVLRAKKMGLVTRKIGGRVHIAAEDIYKLIQEKEKP